MMKGIVKFMHRYQRLVFVVSAVFIIAIIGYPLVMKQLDRRVKYDWYEYTNYGEPLSKEPFGQYYLDEYLRKAWKGKFEVDSTFLGAMKKHSGKRCNYLVFDCEMESYQMEDSLNLFLGKVRNGNNFIFANHKVESLSLLLGVDDYWSSSFQVSDFNKENTELQKKTIGSPKASGRGLTDTCRVWTNMMNSHMIYNPDSIVLPYYAEGWKYRAPKGTVKRNVVDGNDFCYVMTVNLGKGKALFNGSLAFFTNYAMSEPRLWKLNEKVINETFDKSLPLVVVYSQYGNEYNSSFSGEDLLFSALLKNPSTALALYILLAMLLLWVLVNSRRKRRAETEMEREHNSSVSYVEHLATLYTINSDYKELLELEQRKLLYRLRKEFRFDIQTSDFTLPSDYSAILAKSKGYDEMKVKEALLQLEALTGGEGSVNRDSYTKCMKLLIEALRSKD